MTILETILNLLFPPHCSSCKKEGDFFCESCQRQLKTKKIRSSSLHPSAQDFENLDGVIYGMDYAENPQIQAVIRQFKYRFTQNLSEYFGSILAKKLAELNMLKGKKVVLIPVPLHRRRLWERGFNQAELIAKAVQSQMSSECEIRYLLKRNRYTSQQAKLGRRGRLENLADAFEFIGSSGTTEDRIFFLVDDVCTTGATLEHCAEVLRKNGFKKVYGLVVARAL